MRPSQSLAFEFPFAQNISHTIYPGAMLDIDHATNGLVWLANGTIDAISVHSPGDPNDVELEVLDAQGSDGRPVQSSSGGDLYAVTDTAPGAVALKAGLGDPDHGFVSGVPYYNVVSTNTVPSGIDVPQSSLKRFLVREESGANQTSRIVHLIEVPLAVVYGMAILVTGPSVASVGEAISINVSFTPQMTGGVRAARARVDQVSTYIV